MLKNFSEIFTTIEVDTVTGEYYTIIPEQIINELNLYEESEIEWNVDGDEAIIKEKKWKNITYISRNAVYSKNWVRCSLNLYGHYLILNITPSYPIRKLR